MTTLADLAAIIRSGQVSHGDAQGIVDNTPGLREYIERTSLLGPIQSNPKGLSMSVMLATTNPEAARRGTPGPLPALGDMVVYHMRPGEVRAGQKAVPGFVLAVDPDNRQLKLLVMYDHQDMMTLERVPERTGFDQGWALRSDGGSEVAALRAEVLALRMELAGMSEGLEAFKLELAQALFGEHDKPAESFEDRIRQLAADLKPLRAAAKKAK